MEKNKELKRLQTFQQIRSLMEGHTGKLLNESELVSEINILVKAVEAKRKPVARPVHKPLPKAPVKPPVKAPAPQAVKTPAKPDKWGSFLSGLRNSAKPKDDEVKFK